MIEEMGYLTDPEIAKRWGELHPSKSELEQKRDNAFFAIIHKLNSQGRFGETGIYDCGDLGLLWIQAGNNCWEHRWFVPSQEFRELIRIEGREAK